MGREDDKGECMNFFQLEAGYLTIALFALAITAYVTTRPFMGKNAFRNGMVMVTLFLALMIGAHYYMTTQRMATVEQAFNEGKEILCESRENRKAAQSIVVSKKLGWKLKDGLFTNPEYTRPFHSARCIVKKKVVIKK